MFSVNMTLVMWKISIIFSALVLWLFFFCLNLLLVKWNQLWVNFIFFFFRTTTTAASPVVSSTARTSSTLPSYRRGPTWPSGCTVSGWASAAKFARRSSSWPATSSSTITTTPGRAITTTTRTPSVNTPPSPSTPVAATVEGFTQPASWEEQILSSKVT